MVMTGQAMADAFRLDGRRALVTGASRGIGRALAQSLAAAGAYVAGVGRTTELLTQTQHEIEAAGARCEIVTADLEDPRAAQDVVHAARGALGGPLDIVVHCAGTQHREAATTFPPEAWDRVLRVNLTAPFRISQIIGGQQVEDARPGCHIFVASLTSILGLPNLVAYNAAKSGLMGVVRALSCEWAPSGIRVNAISPGYVKTAMTQDVLGSPGDNDRILRRIPMGRLGTTEELGAPTVFLCSDAAAYITGQLLIVDGGWAAA